MDFITTPFDKSKHKRDLFDCLDDDLNQYLTSTISQDISKDLGAAYVCTDESNEIIGFYTLQNTIVTSPDYTSDTSKKVRYNEVPAFLIGRLAVDRKYQGKKYGAKILADALARCLKYKAYSGGRYVVVDASNEKAKAFYQKYGFICTDGNPMKLLILMKNVKKLLPNDS